tara:strand:+ start:790 stop:1143 length:354 start_codon:yes stop_codon:yes gene_type:complete
MKGENYLYFCDTTDEPNAADEAILIPASTVLGISVGAADGTVDDDALYLSCQGFVGDGNSRAAVILAVTAGKLKEAMDDVCSAINANPGDGFTVIADVQNGVYCSEHITGCTVDSAV